MKGFWLHPRLFMFMRVRRGPAIMAMSMVTLIMLYRLEPIMYIISSVEKIVMPGLWATRQAICGFE